ncbi:MAG TPA: DnaJ domain-containing protein [Gaiellaceae bacterium]|nr:DnaJ domain-containing protein [Gaiellaceae bacterium]
MDYYEVLGLQRGADATEIKRAFRAKARLLHPDVSGDPDAEERFRELADAYAALSKPASRLLYDRFGYRGRGAWPAGPAQGLFDLWERSRRRSAGDVAEVELDFYEAARGGRQRVRYRARTACSSCTTRHCPTCDGRGNRRESLDDGDVRVLQLVTCEDCGGTGRFAGACEECGGSGEVQGERETEVTVPSGVEDGARVPVGDDGEQVRIRVRPQPRDPAALRVAAALGLVAALGFLVFLLIG